MINDLLESIVHNNHQKKFSIFLSIIIGILLIIIIILSILFSIERNKIKIHENNQTDDLCLSPYCIETANNFLQSIDETINPCENFYQFTCGKWIKNAKISDDANSQDIFQIMQNKLDDQIIDLLSSNQTLELNSIINAKKFYSSCMNEDEIENDDIYSINLLINQEFGGWPILEGLKWNQSSFNLYNSLIKLSQFNKYLLFYILTYSDEQNSSSYSIYIGQGNLALKDRSYYLNESNITRAYRQFIKDVSLLLTNDTSMIDNDVKQIFNFEKALAQVSWTRAQRYLGPLNRTTFANLSSILNTTFNFGEYLRRVYLFGNVSLANEDIIIVSEIEVLKNISIIIEKESSRTIQNYLIWRFILSQIEYMPRRFRNLKHIFNKIFQGVKTEKARQIKCGQYVNHYMGLAVSKLYINKYFDKNSRQESIEMINNIRNIFTEMMNKTTWMDLQSKNVAIDKINKMNQRIGYPDGLDDNNKTDIEKKYAQYKFNSSFIKNILIINQLNAKENFKKLRESIDRNAWTAILPTDINAYYRPPFNDITFTAAILQTPFFNKDAPKYLNYGGIGMVIGHELTHGFDSIGRQYDKNGNKVRWWTNQTIEEFNKQKLCIIEQYNNYTLTQINLNVNGEQTQGEDIADNGGLKESFFAYQKWAKINKNLDKKLPGLTKYSSEQMFFINFAQLWCSKTTDQYAKNGILVDLHSPPEFRVKGPTSNFIEFDRVFQCKPGQANSRINKCIVW